MKSNTIRICQMVVMAALAAVLVVLVIQRAVSNDGSFNDYYSIAIWVTTAWALAWAFLYLLKGYTKSAAVYYKLFLAFLLLQFVVNFIMPIVRGDVLEIILHTLSILVLLVLVFKKDLGAKNSQILFAVRAALQIAITVLAIMSGLSGRIITNVARLLLIGTLGLMLAGKYADKRARGKR